MDRMQKYSRAKKTMRTLLKIAIPCMVIGIVLGYCIDYRFITSPVATWVMLGLAVIALISIMSAKVVWLFVISPISDELHKESMAEDRRRFEAELQTIRDQTRAVEEETVRVRKRTEELKAVGAAMDLRDAMPEDKRPKA